MQQDEMLLDQVSMVDEEITLDRRPYHEKGAQLSERIVENNPAGTSTGGIDSAAKQEVESDGQFDTGDETVDDKEKPVDLCLQLLPLEMTETNKRRLH